MRDWTKRMEAQAPERQAQARHRGSLSFACGLVVLGSLGVACDAGADTVSGGGGSLGPAGPSGGLWPMTLPMGQFSSPVSIPLGVASVNSITFMNLQNTWSGDLFAVLWEPGLTVGHTIFHRPVFTGTSFGFSGDFNGNYTFMDGAAPLPTSGPSPIPPGTYAPYFGVWPSGSAGVFNGPLSSVSGAGGTWTLRIYDWAGDGGSIGSWILDYDPAPAPGGLGLLAPAGLALARRRSRS